MAFALEGERSQMNDGKKELAERDRARRARLEKLKPEKPAHKQVEEPSLSSKEQWETTFDAISDWVALIDLKGKVLHTNRAGEDFIGKSSTMIIGQSCCRLVHDSDKHIPGCPLIKMCRSRNRETVELQVPGTNRWVMVTVDPVTNAEGKIIGAVHITRDITNRKKAEEALRRSEEYYRMLTETMNDGLQQIDETGRYVYVNNKMGEILGYSPDEMIGGYWTDFFDENAQKIINKKLTQRKKGVAEPYEIENTRRNGQKIFIRISPQPIFDEKGEFRGSFAVVTDITERKEAAQKLQEYQAQLKSLASQMPAVEEHAKQKIAAGLHDNIGQKLAMAKFELQSLMKSISDNTILDSINDICGEITNVIEDVHSLIFEIRNPLLDEIGLTVALEKYITEEIQVKSGIKCELNDKTGDLKLEQNVRSVLYRATRELLMNAVKHSQAHNIKVHIYIHTNNLYIRVEDDGVGFEVGEIILLPTKTGGFGLFSIKEQLEYLEANLQVESRVGNGTKAIITWPLKLKQADQV